MANVVFPEYVIVFVLIGQAAGMCGFVCVFSVWLCMCFGLSVCLCDIMSHLKVPGLTHYEEHRKQLRD